MADIVTLNWSLDDAEEVADIFLRAATRGSKVVDRGFYEDYHSIMRQIEKIREENDHRPRLRVTVVDRVGGS